MILTLWISVLVLFWVFYYHFTKGYVTKHLGFLHYFIFFIAIYLESYLAYSSGGYTNTRYFISVLLYPILSLLGMIAATPFAKKSYFGNQDLSASGLKNERKLVFGVLVFFLIFYVVYLYSLGRKIPLLSLYSASDIAARAEIRYYATTGYEGEGVGGLRLFFWLPRVLIDYYSSFILVFLYYRLVLKDVTRRNFIFFTALLFVMAILSTEKYPAVKLFAVLGLCHFNYKYQKFNFKGLVYAAKSFFVGVVLIGIVYGVVSGAYLFSLKGESDYGVDAKTTLFFGWDMIKNRVIEQTKPLYSIYELIPAQYNYFMGRTFPNPHDILPFKSVALPTLIWTTGYDDESGVQGNAPTAYFGEMYANFGLVVTFLSMFLFGFIVQLLNDVVLRRMDNKKTIYYIAYFYLLMLYIGDFALGFSPLYFDPRFWTLILLFYLPNMRIKFGNTHSNQITASALGDARETV